MKADLASIEHNRHRGRFPEPLARVIADGLALCEGHARDHEKLAAQGWDQLEYLRGQAKLTRALAMRGLHPSVTNPGEPR